MRTTSFSLIALTLALGLAGCGSGGWDDYYVGSEHGQHFGDDSWTHDEFWEKPGSLARFPLSDEGSFVAAGDETVAFQPLPAGALVVRGLPVPTITLLPSGEVQEDGAPRGYVVYTLLEDGRLGTALLSLAGRALGIAIEAGAPRLVQGEGTLALAPAERVPAGPLGLPLATPAP